MCTLIALHRVAGASGTLVAANRDEFYARPTRPPEQLAPRVVAGVDVSQGGTWLGVHASGLFVGLTNQRSFGGRDPSKQTRGAVVTDALAAGGLDASLQVVAGLDAREYNGFNLLLGDGDRLFVAYARPEQREVELHPLAPGVHVLGNDRLQSPDFPKAARIAADAEQHVATHVEHAPPRPGGAPAHAARQSHAARAHHAARPSGVGVHRRAGAGARGHLHPHAALRHGLGHAPRRLAHRRLRVLVRRRATLPHRVSARPPERASVTLTWPPGGTRHVTSWSRYRARVWLHEDS
jgi:hypothetical protein